MRKTMAVLLLIASPVIAATPAGLKKRVAVMDMSMAATAMAQPTGGGGTTFTSTIQIPPPADFAMALTEILTTELAKTGRVIVLERKAMSDIAAEHELAAGGKANPETAARSGAIIGAQYLIRSAISEYSYSQTGTSGSLKVIKGINLGATVLRAQVGIDTRVYDALTSEVIASATSHGTATSSGADVKLSNARMDASAAGFVTTPLGRASREALDGTVRFIIAKLGEAKWEARVIRAEGAQIYVNAGEEAGVENGQTFGVYRAAEALIDPASGVNLGTPDKQVAVVRITNVTPKYSIAELVSGESPKRNDILRPQQRGANP
ncbi:MAG TPA: CsgG/HfaB family protein [Thermoanaerobaculia bacterium]|nr:CsgG/HfaB family protein [Thermoanaerobaculia bacterium]